MFGGKVNNNSEYNDDESDKINFHNKSKSEILSHESGRTAFLLQSGILLKHSNSLASKFHLTRTWKSRYFILTNNDFCYFKSAKDFDQNKPAQFTIIIDSHLQAIDNINSTDPNEWIIISKNKNINVKS